MPAHTAKPVLCVMPQKGTNFVLGCCEFLTDGRCVFMKSPVAKRSIVVRGHKTSVSLEDAFWNSLKEIGGERHMTLSQRSRRSCCKISASRARSIGSRDIRSFFT